MLCKAELCWHHTADLLASYCHLLAGTVLPPRALLRSLAPYCYLVLCSLSSRADSLALYCHLAPCSACWHRTAISCSALCQAELTCWHCTATSHAPLCLLASYCQISMFHSWTSCEEIQEDQLC